MFFATASRWDLKKKKHANNSWTTWILGQKVLGVASLIRKPYTKNRPANDMLRLGTHTKRPSFGSSIPIKNMKTLDLSS